MATDTIARAMAGNAKRLLDEYKNNPDVADIVQNKAALDAYDTSKLSESDIVKVLDDESRNHMETYYKWINNDWDYIGGLGPYYTQTEINNLLLEKLAANQVATIQQNTVASKAYSVGDLLIYNSVLYQVTTDIASGATIIVGTNVAATTIEEVIKNAQKQADWDQADNSAKDFIKNKPIIPDAVTANPELAGTEPDLNGLQVGSIKYKIENGIFVPDGGYTTNWSLQSWDQNIAGSEIWHDGEHIYYNHGNISLEFNKYSKQWIAKTWNGLSDFYGENVWTDGDNIYYSMSTTHKVLNRATSTWSDKTWTGLTNFAGVYIWTDEDNIYYSNGSIQYVLNKENSTWSEKIWNGLTNFNRFDVWTDGDDIYYSRDDKQYILNKATSTWSTKSWDEPMVNSGQYVWTDGTNIYAYSAGSNCDVKLQKGVYKQWIRTNWTGANHINGRYVWTDGENIYLNNYMLDKSGYKVNEVKQIAITGSYNDLKDKPVIPDAQVQSDWNQSDTEAKDYIKNKPTIPDVIKILDEGFSNEWSSVSTGVDSIDGENVWTDGENIYYSNGTVQYVWNKTNKTWETKTWTGLTNFYGRAIWVYDANNIFYSYQSNQYRLNLTNSTWNSYKWFGLTNFNGEYVWKLGTTVYYSAGSTQYQLNWSTSQWTTKTWNGLTNFYGAAIWTDGNYTYYSEGASQYYYDTSYARWRSTTWTGLTSFSGINIWSDGENTYYSNNESAFGTIGQYVLNKTNNTWSEKTWEGLTGLTGYYIWTDGITYYYSYHSNQYQLNQAYHALSIAAKVAESGSYNDLKDKPQGVEISDGVFGNTWVGKTWNYQITSSGYIWTDGTNTYYSNGAIQKVLNASGEWENKTWTGLSNFDGKYVWTDGENVYYSNYTSSAQQYVLNKATSTWTTKAWSGRPTYLNGLNIWSDGTNIYYDQDSDHYVLNKETSTWSTKTWTGLSTFSGSSVWTDDENIYYSNGSTQKVLDKETSTWSDKTWNGITDFYGGLIWTDRINLYYDTQAYYPSQGKWVYVHYVLNRETSTWASQTWVGANDFDGSDVWTDGKNIYISNDTIQCQLDELTHTTEYLSKVAETGSYNDLKDKPDLDAKQNKIDSTHKLSSDLVDDTNQSNKFVSADEATLLKQEEEKCRNLINKSSASITGSGYVIQENELRNYPFEAGTYTFSFQYVGSDNAQTQLNIVDYTTGSVLTNPIFTTNTSGITSVTFTVNTKAYILNYYTNSVGTYNNFMLNEGSEAKSYQDWNGAIIHEKQLQAAQKPQKYLHKCHLYRKSSSKYDSSMSILFDVISFDSTAYTDANSALGGAINGKGTTPSEVTDSQIEISVQGWYVPPSETPSEMYIMTRATIAGFDQGTNWYIFENDWFGIKLGNYAGGNSKADTVVSVFGYSPQTITFEDMAVIPL